MVWRVYRLHILFEGFFRVCRVCRVLLGSCGVKMLRAVPRAPLRRGPKKPLLSRRARVFYGARLRVSLGHPR